jgi:ribosomal protein L5
MSVAASPTGTELRLKQRYRDKIVPALIQRFAYINAMQVPRLIKVVVNIGIGESISNPKAQDAATADLKKITGQQPVVLKSRKAIANFKLRAGLPIGIKVTLRGARMYQFVDKLLSVGLPRIRDFRWFSRRSSTTRSINCGVSRSPSSPPRVPMTRHARCWRSSGSPSGSEVETEWLRNRR